MNTAVSTLIFIFPGNTLSKISIPLYSATRSISVDIQTFWLFPWTSSDSLTQQCWFTQCVFHLNTLSSKLCCLYTYYLVLTRSIYFTFLKNQHGNCKNTSPSPFPDFLLSVVPATSQSMKYDKIPINLVKISKEMRKNFLLK